jgi:hypothetical protein
MEASSMNKHQLGIADIHVNFRKIMTPGKELKAWQIQVAYLREYGKRYSESSITARLREMKDVRCDLSTYTYKLCG